MTTTSDDTAATTATRQSPAALGPRLLAGAAGGLAGGLVFGLMMQAMGMIPMVAGLVGSDAVAVGWLVHLAISVALGLGFAAVLGGRLRSWGAAVGLGAAYGLVWWVLGALIAMPARMGMPLLNVDDMALQSLMGHLVFGVILGAVAFPLARSRA